MGNTSRQPVIRLSALVLTTLFALPAGAASYTVKAGGGGDYATIQACAGATVAGDTCTVFAGTYDETVTPPTSGTAGQPITFQANAGDAVTVRGFDLGNRSYVTIGGSAANQGFEITGGNIAMTTRITSSSSTTTSTTRADGASRTAPARRADRRRSSPYSTTCSTSAARARRKA